MTFRDIVRQHIGPPVNIEAIIRGVGIELNKKAELDDGVSGQLERLGPNSYRISANRKDHYLRQRFTMAHELGHYMLHAHLIGDGVDDTVNDTIVYRSLPTSNFYNPNITSVEETEANKFAAELLMPRSLLAVGSTVGQNLSALAKSFQVSPRAMEIRLIGLGFSIEGDKVTAANP
jgi:Zn-dependent peptidase ImmA (M78 family)